LAPVQVSFYRRMKFQRVYPVVVRWKKGAVPAAGKKVGLRLLLAGAQVLPTEQPLDAGKSNDQVTFYVTPLAKGWLRAQRLEILLDGRKVQEVPLASKVVTQRLTWFLLLMALLVPWLIHAHIRNSPFIEREMVLVDDERGRKVVRLDAKTFYVQDDKGNKKVKTLEQQVRENWAQNVPEMPGTDKEEVGETVADYVSMINDGLVTARDWTAEQYAYVVDTSQTAPYSAYGGMIFLGLTLLSALMHMDVRRKRTSKPIPLPQAARMREEEAEEAEEAAEA
jgi:hypothetical protein